MNTIYVTFVAEETQFLNYNVCKNHAMSQAISDRLLMVEARVRFQAVYVKFVASKMAVRQEFFSVYYDFRLLLSLH